MSWQTITKQNNLDISIIGLSALEENTRIDAEYYRPEYLVPHRKGLELSPIGDILTKCQYGISQEMNEEGIGVEIYRMNDLENGLCKDSDLKFVDIDEQKAKLYRLKPNDILFNRVNSIQFVGRTAIYKHENRSRVFASYLIRLNTREKEVLPDYLNIFLNCKYGRKELVRKARWAVNQANVNAEELKRIALPIASASLQKVVENVVNKAHSLITKARDAYKEVERLLLKEINLAEYKPSEENISVRSLSDSLAENRFDAEYWQPKYEELFARMKNTIILGQMAKVKRGSLISPDYYSSEGTPYIRGGDFSTGEIDKSGMVYIAPDFKKRKEVTVNRDDIVFASIGSVGKTALVTEKFDKSYISNNIGKITITDKKYLPQYVQVCLQSIIGQLQLERLQSRTAQPKISDVDIAKLKITTIQINKQEQVSEKASEARKQKDEAEKLLEKAKRAVEIFIEQDEKQALAYLNQ